MCVLSPCVSVALSAPAGPPATQDRNDCGAARQCVASVALETRSAWSQLTRPGISQVVRASAALRMAGINVVCVCRDKTCDYITNYMKNFIVSFIRTTRVGLAASAEGWRPMRRRARLRRRCVIASTLRVRAAGGRSAPAHVYLYYLMLVGKAAMHVTIF